MEDICMKYNPHGCETWTITTENLARIVCCATEEC